MYSTSLDTLTHLCAWVTVAKHLTRTVHTVLPLDICSEIFTWTDFQVHGVLWGINKWIQWRSSGALSL